MKRSVPNHEGENQVSDKKEESASRRTVSRCSAISPKVSELEDTQGQSKEAMVLTKGWIDKWIDDANILRLMVLRSTFLATINTFFKLLVWYLSFNRFHYYPVFKIES
ncbi:hypothetical protein MTR67_007446 [Solanum verrucosum]|uniref:Uncharacterized protein n=1 Tax=Solanum verrucosum TaxID=315347 RepID=A0AAF0TCR8_SOLVR|nr:hypothetical protein MTR67_007446 [Solanum verrucosum]